MGEYNDWLQQAESDFEKARILFDNDKYDGAAFFCQQCVEKGLKALLIKEKNELIKTHSVLLLAKKLNLPKEILDKISIFQPVYQATRYPDISVKKPSEEFEKAKVQDMILITDEVIKWIKERMK